MDDRVTRQAASLGYTNACDLVYSASAGVAVRVAAIGPFCSLIAIGINYWFRNLYKLGIQVDLNSPSEKSTVVCDYKNLLVDCNLRRR